MISFQRFDRATVLFFSLLIVAFLMATFDVRSEGGGVGGSLREGAQTVFSPVQGLATATFRPIVGFVDGVSNIATLRDEVDRLRDENDSLRDQLLDFSALETRLEELAAINDLEAPGDLSTVTARISSLSPTDFDQIRWIDKGAADGIAEGQAVIDEDGLIGRIDFVTDNSARVRLITDPRSGVGVRDLETNETGWIEGQGAGDPLLLRMFGSQKPVEIGDSLVTDGTRYPPGLEVGSVLLRAEAEANFALITEVEPSMKVSEIDFVKVIVGWSPLDVADEDVSDGDEGNRLVTEE